MRATIHRIAKNPYLNLFAGLALLGTSGWEVIQTLEEAGVGAHHGIVVFALVQLLKVFPEAVEGVRGVHEGLEQA